MAGKRLLFVVNDPQSFLSHRLALALEARQAGYEVRVATGPGDGAERIEAHGLTHDRLPLVPAGTHPLTECRALWAIARLFWRLRPDLVHLITIKPVLYGGLMARLLRVPGMVAGIAGLGYLFTRQRRGFTQWLVKQLYRVALRHPNSAVMLENAADGEVLQAMGALRPGQGVVVPGSGVALDEFVATPLADGVPVVLLPARMLWDKGVGEFVEAARQLHNRGVQARFVLVGDHSSQNPTAIPRETLEQCVQTGIVEWWGFQSDMPSVLKAAHVVVLPSYREGLSRALLEGLATGRPVITTDAPGCREVVDEGWNGLLVEPGEVDGLAIAMEALINDPARCALMGQRGRVKAEAEFGVARVVDAQLRVYRALIAGTTP